MSIDELIEERKSALKNRDYKRADEIRNALDAELVFIFDHPDGFETHYLTEKWFRKKPPEMSHRKYVEKRIKQDIRAEKLLNAWIFTNSQRI